MMNLNQSKTTTAKSSCTCCNDKYFFRYCIAGTRWLLFGGGEVWGRRLYFQKCRPQVSYFLIELWLIAVYNSCSSTTLDNSFANITHTFLLLISTSFWSICDGIIWKHGSPTRPCTVLHSVPFLANLSPSPSRCISNSRSPPLMCKMHGQLHRDKRKNSSLDGLCGLS